MAVDVSIYKSRIAGSIVGDTLVFNEEEGKADLASMQIASLTEYDDIKTDKLEEISNDHDDTFINTLNSIKTIKEDLRSLNQDYNDLRSIIENAVQKVQASTVNNFPPEITNRIGNVGGGDGSGAGGGQTPIENAPEIVPAPIIGPDPIISANTQKPWTLEPSPTPSTPPASPTPTTSDPTPTEGPYPSPSATPFNSLETPVPTLEQSSLPTSTQIGMVPPPLVGNISSGDNQTVGATWNGFTPEEQDAATRKLQDLGFSEAEISQMAAGSTSAQPLAVNEIANTLQENYSPELRKELISRYGFDVFNDDGTVNKEKLALALTMDNKDDADQYSMVEELHKKGIDVVNQALYDEISEQLMQGLITHPDFRQRIIDKYGFDIFNADGSINRDKLTLAILMDMQDSADDYDLLNYLTELYGEEKASAIINTVKPEVEEVTKKSGNGIVTTIAGVGLLGATAGGIAYLAAKKNDEEEKLEYMDDDELSEDSSEQPSPEELEEAADEKEWLYGLGLGLAARKNSDIGISNTTSENTDSNEEKDSNQTNEDIGFSDNIKPDQPNGVKIA